MKKIVINKREYDKFVYPTIALALHKTVRELRMNNKVLKKLEVEGIEISTKPTPEEARIIGSDVPMLELKTKSAVFNFEDNEAEYLHEKLENLLPRVQGRILRFLLPIFAALQEEVDE